METIGTNIQGQKLLDKLNNEVSMGYLRRSYSEDNLLAIYCYTSKCECEGDWTPIRKMARGLVVNSQGDIVIKCVPKFFNIDTEESISQQELLNKSKQDNSKLIYTEKNDGYLIQIKNDSKYGLIVTSKGSFTTKYADFAKNLVKDADLPKDITFICELLHDFEGDEGIIVTRHNKTSLVVWEVLNERNMSIIEDFYSGAQTLPDVFELTQRFTAEEYLEYMKREGVEGVVILNQDSSNDIDNCTGWRVKHKTPEFFLRHSIAAHCTKRHAFKLFLNKEDNIEELDIPDEFREKMQGWFDEFHKLYQDYVARVTQLAIMTQGLSQKGLWLNTSLQLTESEKAAITYMRLGKTSKFEEVCYNYVKEQISFSEEE